MVFRQKRQNTCGFPRSHQFASLRLRASVSCPLALDTAVRVRRRSSRSVKVHVCGSQKSTAKEIRALGILQAVYNA